MQHAQKGYVKGIQQIRTNTEIRSINFKDSLEKNLSKNMKPETPKTFRKQQ